MSETAERGTLRKNDLAVVEPDDTDAHDTVPALRALGATWSASRGVAGYRALTREEGAAWSKEHRGLDDAGEPRVAPSHAVDYLQQGATLVVTQARSAPDINGARRPGMLEALDLETGRRYYIARRHVRPL
jgi:hypothetical protein